MLGGEAVKISEIAVPLGREWLEEGNIKGGH